MKTIFSVIIFLLFISPNCYGTSEINDNEMLLGTHDTAAHARRVRDIDNRHVEGHHVAPRRLSRREAIQNKKPKNILKNKKYKTV